MFSKLFKLHTFLTAYLSNHICLTRLTIEHALLTLPSKSEASRQGGGCEPTYGLSSVTGIVFHSYFQQILIFRKHIFS